MQEYMFASIKMPSKVAWVGNLIDGRGVADQVQSGEGIFHSEADVVLKDDVAFADDHHWPASSVQVGVLGVRALLYQKWCIHFDQC